MYGRMSLCLFLSLLLCIKLGNAQLTPCTDNDMEYKYTECDAKENRWRVYVPKADSHCKVDSPKPPIQGPKCDKACDAGEYLDVNGNQECQKCESGTYSVGDGVRYDQWDTLNTDVFTVTEGKSSYNRNADCANKSTHWIPRTDYLEGVPGDCDSDFTFSAELINEGTLTIEYENTYKAMLAIVRVKSMCQSSSEEKGSALEGVKMLPKTSGDSYTSEHIKLSKGANKVTISLIGVRSHTPGVKFAIRSLEITGMAFTSTCTPCKPGYHSSGGASFCEHCPENTYSPKSGSDNCLQCPSDEFSPPGSTECKARPPCTQSDYYTTIAPCLNETTHVTYEWLEPQYCNEDHPNSVNLPEVGEEIECPSCNPGQSMSEAGVCTDCDDGEFSDGSVECQQCPLHTVAHKSLSFRHFHVVPDRFSTGCIKTNGAGSFCDKQSTWVPSKDGAYMKVSSDIGDEEFSVLNVNVSGFSNVSLDGRIYGRLKLKFQMKCAQDDPCVLYLMQEDTDERAIMTWNSSHTGGVFTHNFTTPNVKTLSLAFRKSIVGKSTPSSNTVSVSEITLTNTLHGGAIECSECALGGTAKGCHSCEKGEVIITNNSTNEKTCGKCEPNHIVVDSFTCTPCGPGLVSNSDSTECISDCSFNNDGMRFDFTPISGVQYFNASKSFTIQGTPYSTGVKFALCSSVSGEAQGQRRNDRPTCGTPHRHLPSAFSSFRLSARQDDSQMVTSLICRETILPAETTVSIQPSSLGDTLASVTTNNKTERTRLIKQGGVHIADDELTVHYRYATHRATDHCSHGLSTTITLICDVSEPGNGTVSFPPQCVTGTCQGCDYQLIWRSRHACPKCEESDYEKIQGECKHGKQSVRYLPQKYCPMTDEIRKKVTTQECSMLTMQIKIGILVSAGIGLLLFVCVIYCWKRSKKMEVKYMKLVEGAQGKDGELPAAQTCAWSDEDEEEELNNRVAFKSKGDKLFGKLGNSSKGDGFEKMKLVGSSLPEI